MLKYTRARKNQKHIYSNINTDTRRLNSEMCNIISPAIKRANISVSVNKQRKSKG